MRASAPVTRVEAGHLVVTTALVAADGTELEPLVVRVPVSQADLLDPTATPGLGPLTVLAAARGEDLHVEGPVDRRSAAGAQQVLSTLADWWGLPPLAVEVDDVFDAPDDGGAIGLFFSRDVASWSALLGLLDEAPGDRVTHLIAVRSTSARSAKVDDELIDGHRAVAAELGLEVVEVESSAQAMLHPYRRWIETAAPAVTGTGLQVAARMRRLVLVSEHPTEGHPRIGLHPDLFTPLGSGRTEVVAGAARRARGERTVPLLGSPLARRTLYVCGDDGTASNCGRCSTCLVTMAELAIAGDPDPAAGFDAPIDPEHVRRTALGPEVEPFLASILEDLPPPYEELRRAWSDAWDAVNGRAPRARWGDDAPPALAGPSLPQRVAAALRATTGQPVAPAPAPLGWRTGTVALRPPLDRHGEIRALVGANPDRPHAWAVVEHHIRDEARDGHQADLALALAEHLGTGPTYLPGILWAWLEPPVLDAVAVQQLLRTARARLWWRADGDLEPLRVLEAIEQGCLPLQVMPTAAARNLAGDLPPPLAPLVVDEASLPALDLSPAAVAALLAPAADHLLAGSAEHDLLAGAHS